MQLVNILKFDGPGKKTAQHVAGNINMRAPPTSPCALATTMASVSQLLPYTRANLHAFDLLKPCWIERTPCYTVGPGGRQSCQANPVASMHCLPEKQANTQSIQCTACRTWSHQHVWQATHTNKQWQHMLLTSVICNSCCRASRRKERQTHRCRACDLSWTKLTGITVTR